MIVGSFVLCVLDQVYLNVSILSTMLAHLRGLHSGMLRLTAEFMTDLFQWPKIESISYNYVDVDAIDIV